VKLSAKLGLPPSPPGRRLRAFTAGGAAAYQGVSMHQRVLNTIDIATRHFLLVPIRSIEAYFK
jgi:hypothetical protein